MARKAPKGSAKFQKVMREYERGGLHSGSKTGRIVTNPKQVEAIAYSEASKASYDTGKYSQKKYRAKGKRGNPVKDVPLARNG